MKFKFRVLPMVVVIILVCAEFSARLLGVLDFPIYVANSQIGYIPAVSQSGVFLNKNAWRFNELHMGADTFVPSAAGNVLLIGDSLVLGGNPYREPDRLGPQLQSVLPPSVRTWPISAGSWALRNELAWLRANPHVVQQSSALVWVVNSGDFAEASSWSCELSHPTRKPLFALGYLFEKYVYTFSPCNGTVPADLQVPPGDLRDELQKFLAGYGHKVLFVWYADKSQQVDLAQRQVAQASQLNVLKEAGAVHVITVADDFRWSENLYRDGIHPTSEGNRVLALIIVDALVKSRLVQQ